MNRRRSRIRQNFPRNLYENDGYFSYRNPMTKETFGLGRNRAKAFEIALACNLRLLKDETSIIDRIFGDKRTVAEWETEYGKILDELAITPATRSNYRTFSRHVVRTLGAEKPIIAVSAMDVAQALKKLEPRTAKAVLPYMRNSFEECVSQGWRETNPVRVKRIATPTPVTRARLSLDVFMKVYESAPTEWLRNAMALALVSAQRREDVCRAEYKHFRDGGWWLTQASEKTDHPHRIFIPDDIKPAGFPLSLRNVLAQCRRTRVASSYLVHQTVRRGPSEVGRPLRLSTVSRGFTDAIQALGIDFSPKTPPTFHEIRSLSLRLYGDQGVNVQLLAGHTDPDTTAIYLNSRGQDYARVTV